MSPCPQGVAPLLLGSALLVACSNAPPAPRPTPTPETLTEALDAARIETGVPGAAAAIIQDGVLRFAGASGDAAHAPLRPLRATSLLSLPGVTEMATAVMVLHLAEQGRLTLDNPLSRYVSRVPGADQITLRMLLAHRSGLPDYQGLSFDEIYYSFQDPAHVWTRAEILDAIDPDDDIRPPGSYRYSQTDYIALGEVIERASGIGVDAFFQELIARPLDLQRCVFRRDPALAPDVAQGFAYDAAAKEYVSIFPPDGSVPTYLWGPVWTDGGLMCTAQDAARFTDALLSGRLVSRDALASMTSFGPEGYGLGVASKTDGGHPLEGHAGTKPGYDAAAWYDPARRLTIVALTNGVGPNFLAGTVFQRMDEAYARGAAP